MNPSSLPSPQILIGIEANPNDLLLTPYPDFHTFRRLCYKFTDLSGIAAAYSKLSNKHTVRNKRTGMKIFKQILNARVKINAQGIYGTSHLTPIQNFNGHFH